MAPVCVACRLSLSALFVFVLFVSFVISNVSSLYVYDHQTLLDLRPSAKDLVKLDPDHRGHTTSKPFHLSGIPAHLRCTFAPFPRRKRRRRRGKCSGKLVKVKALLARSSVVSLRRNGLGSGLFPHLRSLHPVDSWLLPVVGSDGMVRPHGPCSPRPRRRGVNPRHLRALCEQVVEPVVRVYPAASRGQLLCVASGMFPPLVKLSWKRQKERGGVEVLPSADSRQQKLQETGCSASILHINQQEISSDQYLCNVQHQGGTREVPAPTGPVTPAPTPSPSTAPTPSPSTAPTPSPSTAPTPSSSSSPSPSPSPPLPASPSVPSQHQVKLLSLLYSLLIVKSLVYCCGLFLMTILRDK
ncbi:ras-associated and pleckstrin homology domains-containing protein 1-like [Xyrichtys novacula]|uniref:Ras-associated and pleckstrin homology domains-containing protein 1-like n=1 Tax=Xyrichtys novacula TaxID=13765 RepID=A0AAV1HPY6_XYRNO|nr:ras-associated and pleckstrin homology domains-containing protein 1-like [Xyrichtys novacula]